MKAIQRIPTTQYGYIELEMDYETPEEAFIDHTRLQKLYEDGTGLTPSEWKKCREEVLNSGGLHDEEIHNRMNKAQRWWIHETTLALRALRAEEPIIK